MDSKRGLSKSHLEAPAAKRLRENIHREPHPQPLAQRLYEAFGVAEALKCPGPLLEKPFAGRATTRLTSQGREHFNKAVNEMSEGTPVDGTPCNWDWTQCVESIAMSFPGHSEANLRVPFTEFLKRHTSSPKTFDDLLTVFVWSLKWIALGCFPPCRHDGEPFRADEQHRAKTAGGVLKVKGVLVELRGDWACMKEIFRLPGWRGAPDTSCCFRCSATIQTMKIVGLDAPWRAERRSYWQLLEMWRQQAILPSPIIGAPWFSSSVFQLDWLHVMDIGVTLDFLANAFLVLLRHYPQSTMRERTHALFRSIQEYYTSEKIDSILETLTPKMLQQHGSQPPKLRARGAVARGHHLRPRRDGCSLPRRRA